MKTLVTIFILSSWMQGYAQKDSIRAEPIVKKAMVLAKKNADSLLISFFGQSLFRNNILWDSKFSRVDADGNIFYTTYNDTFSFKPEKFELNYKIYQEGIFIAYFYIDADRFGNVQKLSLDDYIYYDLIGFKKMLDGSFNITAAQALIIGEKHGITDSTRYVKMAYSWNERSNMNTSRTPTYFYKVSFKNCKKCKTIHINPKSGLVTKEYYNKRFSQH